MSAYYIAHSLIHKFKAADNHDVHKDGAAAHKDFAAVRDAHIQVGDSGSCSGVNAMDQHESTHADSDPRHARTRGIDWLD